MRDYLVLGLLFASLPFCFLRPHIGVLVYLLASLLNPHRMTWGIAYHFPVAMLIGIATGAGFLMSRGKRPLPREREVWLILLFGVYVTFTSVFALYPQSAWLEWERLAKTIGMVFISLFLFQSRERLRLLLLCTSLSLAAFGVKGALFAMRTGGEYIVFGPPGSFIEDNNALALAELMVLPLLVFLGQQERAPWAKWGLYGAAGLSLLAVIFSYSRGALVALVALGLGLLLTSAKRLQYAFFLAAFLLIVLPFVPQKWDERMSTIKTFEEDRSAMGRINAWGFAFNLASDRPLVGGGFRTFQWEMFRRYAPVPEDVHDAHSIYFEVLGEHGFVALGIYAWLLFGAIVSLRTMRRRIRHAPELEWAGAYSSMLELSLIAYAVGGAFLGLAYFDLFYYLLAATICLKTVVREQLRASAAEEEDAAALGGAEPAQALESVAARNSRVID